MDNGLSNTRFYGRSIAMLVVAAILTGCGGLGSATPLETPSAIPPNATPTLNYKEQFFAQVTETVAAARPEIALTGVPTWTPGPPPPGPTATPRLGLFTSCARRSSRDPLIVTCWVGVLNSQIVDVDTGKEGLDGDPDQGVVVIYTRGTHDTQLIETPDKVGAVQIISVDGSRFTLTTVDHQPMITYAFDAATRQWVNP